MKFTARNLKNINSALIEMRGITFIFGENGSGKSNLINGIGHTANNASALLRNRDNTIPDTALDSEVNCHYLSEWTDSPYATPSKSQLAQNNPKIVQCLNDILKGEFVYENEVLLKKYDGSKIPFKDVGHGIKHLWELWVYINYHANYGDLILMDCPERYLSLKNQRKLARLFALLANNSIKVCAATQSDTMAKEINILIAMYSKRDKLPYEIPSEIYSEDLFLPHTSITAYDFLHAGTKMTSTKVNGISTITTEHFQDTFEMPVEKGLGISCYRFDDTIEDMNMIHESLIWGE